MRALFHAPTMSRDRDQATSRWRLTTSQDAFGETWAAPPTPDQEHFSMRAYFGLTAVGLIVAALCGAALSWDGSGYLFETLDKQVPFIPNGRLITLPLLLPVLLVSRVTANLGILQVIFGLTYAAVPLGALAASWWVVRDSARPLFVWAVFSIGLGMLPGQFNMTAEANVALQLFWPILLALLVGMRRVHAPLVLAFAVAVLFSHPYAIGLFALAAAVALVVGLRHKSACRRMRWWAVGFGLLALLALFASVRSSYNIQQVSSGGLGWSLDVSTAGLPLAALACALLAATAVFAAPHVARRRKPWLTRSLRAIEAGSIISVAVVLTMWARDPHLWRWANRYTYPALFASLCFMTLAVLEGLAHLRVKVRDANADSDNGAAFDWPHRLRTIQAIALVFALILCVQGVSWFNLTNRLRETIDQNSWGCVSMAPLGWLQQTPLNQFATPDESILLQGRAPQKVVLSGNGCGDTTFSGGVRLNQYYLRGWRTGWFNLRPLEQRLLAERNVPEGCSFMLSTGWYATETDGPYWWRWSDGRDARIRVLLDRTATVVVNGQVESARNPNTVDVLIAGKKRATFDIPKRGRQPLQPLSLGLKRGENTIQFVSRNSAMVVGGRALAIEIANLTAVSTDNAAGCDLHP